MEFTNGYPKATARPIKARTEKAITTKTAAPRRGSFHRWRMFTSGLRISAMNPPTSISNKMSRSR